MTDLARIAQSFGVSEAPELLEGGQGTTYRAGSIVLKPAHDAQEAQWLADAFSTLHETEELRIPKPVRSARGNWIEDGYAAWTFVAGEHREGRYAEKIRACRSYHALVSGLAKPAFLSQRTDPWSVADRKVWEEADSEYAEDLMALVRPLLSRIEPLDLPSQLLHGDFGGNVLFADDLPPAVIDFTPYWRPADFAVAVILIDAATWDARVIASELRAMRDSIPAGYQLVLRAAVRRIFEQFEHMARGKDRATALRIVEEYRGGYKRLCGNAEAVPTSS